MLLRCRRSYLPPACPPAGLRARVSLRTLVLSGTLALLTAGLVLWMGRSRGKTLPPSPASSVSASTAAGEAGLAGRGAGPGASAAGAAPDFEQRLLALASRWGNTAGAISKREPAAVQADLRELDQRLRAMPAADAARLVERILDRGTDVTTGLGFRLGPGGALQEAPTLRAFLLEELAAVDPAEAARYGRELLRSPTSPDEWALALRNVARVGEGPADRQFVLDRFRAMLAHEPWQRDPSVGFLEAFDVAVHYRATELIPALAALVRREDNAALAHAAYLALDRLVLNEPARALGALQSEPSAMAGREQTRANYFARADVRDPAQRDLLEGYLLNPALGPLELEKFAGLYPSANFMVSQNLLTPTATPGHAELAARDREALGQVQRWGQDPRFERLRPQLAQIERRLQEFTRQAAAQGP